MGGDINPLMEQVWTNKGEGPWGTGGGSEAKIEDYNIEPPEANAVSTLMEQDLPERPLG